MKKFSIIAAFLFAVMISSTALAADWAEVYSSAEDGFEAVYYVDKDSITRGIQSEKHNFSRPDGFTVMIKTELKTKKPNPIIMYWLTGFFEENGKPKYCILDGLDAEGISHMKSSDKIVIEDVDGTKGECWPFVYDYCKKNLP